MIFRKCSWLIILALFAIVAGSCSGGNGEDDTEPLRTEQPSQTVTPTPSVETPPTEEEDSDFRSVRWGMNQREVRAHESEGILAVQDDSIVCYTDISVAGFDTSLCYQFNINDELFGTMYMITEQHSNDTLYINDYENLKDRLTEKYGLPESDDVIWLDDLWRDDPSDWGMAIITGDLKYFATWEVDDMSITLMLIGDNYDVMFSLIYETSTVSNDTGETGLEGL